MWKYEKSNQEQALRSVTDIPHLAAHHAYFQGEQEQAIFLYRTTLDRWLPQLRQEETERPARVILRFASRLAFYALRSGEETIIQDLWERYALAYKASILDPEAAASLCILAILTGHADSAQAKEAMGRISPTSPERVACIGILEQTQTPTALQALESHFSNYDGEGNPRRPWDDDPLIACYELLHQKQQTHWLENL